MREFGPAIFALLLVGVAFFGSYQGMQSRDTRDRDAEIEHQATQDRHTAQGGVTAGHQTEITPEQGKEHHENRDFFGPEWSLVWVSAVLATFTYLLFRATSQLASDAQRTAAGVRSIIRGSGQKHSTMPGIFIIEASNAGTGPALIETVEWGFGPSSVFAGPPSYGAANISNEMVHPQTRTQPVRFVRIPTPRPVNQVIFVRLAYYDVNRKRHASHAFVMLIDSPAIPQISVFVAAPAAYLEDTFPIDEG